MNSDIEEAKSLLPLPRVMELLGFGDRAKKSARCPFHDDHNPSFGIYQNDGGEYKFKCHACGTAGDSIDFIAKAKGIDIKEATKEFLRMAGVTSETREPKARPPEAKPAAPPVQPRPLSELLDEVIGFLEKWVVFQYPEQAIICALWVLHTWLISAFDYTPYLWVFAADMRSGKSRLLEVLNLLSRKPELTESGSSAALVRSINQDDPITLLLDELDCAYGSKKNDAEADSLRRFLNAGFKRNATFLRCVGQGSNQIPTKFQAFCPKALAGIGRDLPATVQDRSLPIELVRQSREKRAERLRDREAKKATERTVTDLKALEHDQVLINSLRETRPALPEKLGDRQQDITEPLVAIADHAGGGWPESARAALVKLYGQEEEASFGVKLLVAAKAAFDDSGKDRLTTKQLLDALVEMEDGPWASMFEDALKHDRLQTASSKLARILKSYKRPDGERIKPHPIKVEGETVKGFYRNDFEAAWVHWLPVSSLSVTSVTESGSVTGFHEGKMAKSNPVTLVTPTHEGKGEAVREPDEPGPAKSELLHCSKPTALKEMAHGPLSDLMAVLEAEAKDGLHPAGHDDCVWGVGGYPQEFSAARHYLEYTYCSAGGKQVTRPVYGKDAEFEIAASLLRKIDVEAWRGRPLVSHNLSWCDDGFPPEYHAAKAYVDEQMKRWEQELLEA